MTKKQKTSYKILLINVVLAYEMDVWDWENHQRDLHKTMKRHPKAKIFSFYDDQHDVAMMVIYEGRKTKGIMADVREAIGIPDSV